MIQEYETVELKTDLPKYGLHKGAKGTVVMIHRGGEAYEVEFFDQDGDTIVIATCLAAQIYKRGSHATQAPASEPSTDKQFQPS